MFLTHDLSNISDDFRGTYHLNKIYVKINIADIILHHTNFSLLTDTT